MDSNTSKVPKISFLEWCIVLGIALQAFLYWPWARIPHEVPKVWLVIGGVMLMSIISLVVPAKKALVSRVMNQPLFFSIMIYFIICLVASLFGSNIARGLIGNVYRIDGIMTLSTLFAYSLLLFHHFSHQSRYFFSLSMVVSSTIISILAVCSFISSHVLHLTTYPDWQGAIGLTFGQPNFLGGYLLVELPISWYVLKKSENKTIQMLTVIGMIFQCFAIFGTYSWAASAGIALFLFFLFTFQYPRLKWRNIAWFITVLCCISLFIIVSLKKDEQTYIAESRYRIYTSLWEAFLHKPWLGWGVANVDQAFMSVAFKGGHLHEIFLDKAHSEWLEVLVTTGLIGAGAYAVFLFSLLKKLTTSREKDVNWKNALTMVLFLYLFHSQTNVISISEQLLFWFVVGYCLVEKERESTKKGL